jgi:hypothetical protein
LGCGIYTGANLGGGQNQNPKADPVEGIHTAIVLYFRLRPRPKALQRICRIARIALTLRIVSDFSLFPEHPDLFEFTKANPDGGKWLK